MESVCTTHIQKRSIQGFTLLELLIVLAIATILMFVGVPSFQGTIERNKITALTDQLLTSFTLARSEAVKRNASVSIRAQNSNNWQKGWCVTSATETSCADKAILLQEGDDSLSVSVSKNVIVFNALGNLEGGTLDISVCNAGSKNGKTLMISVSGQIIDKSKTDC